MISSLPELVLLAFVYLAFGMKAFHLAPANLVLTLSSLPLGFIYLVFGTFLFSNSDFRQLKAKNMTAYHIAKLIFGFMGGLGLCFLITGCWAIMLYLPVGTLYFYVALILLPVTLVAGIILSFRFKRFGFSLIRLLISLVLVLLPFILLPGMMHVFLRSLT